MSTISAGTTVGTALVQTGDTTGNLVIKTGSSATTALTISGADQSITVAGGLNLGAPIAIASGGTGQTTRQAAMDALAGAVTAGRYLRGDGTDVIMDTLKAGDMTGTLAVANGGTGTASPSLVGGTNITISGSWPNQTVTAAGGGVTSLNGQTGAITNTDFNAIGSYTAGVIASTFDTQYSAGTTIAGSLIVQRTDQNGSGLSPFQSVSAGNTSRTNNSKTGTWRAMAFSRNGPNSCGDWPLTSNLWVRIS
jgi:hypothetical protein